MLEDLCNAGRVQHHGEITDLTNGFALINNLDGKNRPFSLCIVPKSGNDDTGCVVTNCKLVQDSTQAPMPLLKWAWSEGLFLQLAADSIDLTKWRVFWGGMGNI